jgi:hypothetical protein
MNHRLLQKRCPCRRNDMSRIVLHGLARGDIRTDYIE